MELSFDYSETPRNSNGIIRSRTGELRSWQLPKKLRALETFNDEFSGAEFPGIYILLFENRREAYVGEAKSLYNRLRTHVERPEDKIKDWTHALAINDGRSASQSDFNDTVVRKTLEWHLIKLLKLNRYRVLSQGEAQRLNPAQKNIIDPMMPRLNFLLLKKNLIIKTEEKLGEEEVLLDECKSTLKKKGYTINKWGAKDAVINGEKVFIRPGSKKPNGWQVTIRGKKPGSFIDSTQKRKGYLLMPRDGILLIPLREIRKIIEDRAFEQDTVDVWINFKEDEVELSYKDHKMNVTPFKILK